jgi:2'-5' RNA ligase
MKLVVAIYPPQFVQDIANSYRKRYDPLYALIAPHIKLTDIFEANDEQVPTIVQHLRQVAQETEIIPVKIHKVSHFHPTNNVLYLAIQDEQPLTRLHRKIYHPAIIQQKPAYAYVPHLTIGQKLSDDELHDIYGQLRMKKIQFEFTVTRFHLLQQMENKVWTTYETFSLE